MYEVNYKDNDYKVEILSRNGNKITISVDDRVYDIDVTEPESGIFSILYNNKSVQYSFFPEKDDRKKYKVYHGDKEWNLEIIDPQRRYRKSRKGDDGDDSNYISTPMPGKVVKILVKEGDKVPAGSTVIIISAMKMESEYKVTSDRVVKEVLVKEGDNIDGDQPLIIFE